MTARGAIVAAASSGSGKTTVTLALLSLLAQRGHRVAYCKVGPDYIDPAFHRAASGRESFNLDSWAMPGTMLDGMLAAAEGVDLVLAEGSMGLFDGVAQAGEARLTQLQAQLEEARKRAEAGDAQSGATLTELAEARRRLAEQVQALTALREELE